MMRRLIGWSALAAAAGGCGPGWTAAAGGTGAGYDVYRPEPYLLVVEGGATTQPAAGAGRYSAQIVYLPDYSQRYRVRSVAGGTTIVIRDGWMLSELADQNALAGLVNSALSSAGPGGPGGGLAGLATLAAVTAGEPSSAARPPTAGALAGGRPGVSLFKIVYGPGGRVTGLDRVQPVEGEMPRSGSLADHAPPPVPVYVPE